jgi:hypothetical protein
MPVFEAVVKFTRRVRSDWLTSRMSIYNSACSCWTGEEEHLEIWPSRAEFRQQLAEDSWKDCGCLQSQSLHLIQAGRHQAFRVFFLPHPRALFPKAFYWHEEALLTTPQSPYHPFCRQPLSIVSIVPLLISAGEQCSHVEYQLSADDTAEHFRNYCCNQADS